MNEDTVRLAEGIRDLCVGEAVESVLDALVLTVVSLCKSSGMTRKEFRQAMGEQWDGASKAMAEAQARKTAAVALAMAHAESSADEGAVDEILRTAIGWDEPS